MIIITIVSNIYYRCITPIFQKSDYCSMADQIYNLMNLPDTSIPPPPLPPGYKTLLYPAYTDKLSYTQPAAKQMKIISLNRRSGEETMYINGKHHNYRDIRSMNQQLARYCEICSEYKFNRDIQPTPCFHTHNSSKNYRINAPLDVWGNYPCYTCTSTPHSCKIGVRYPVLVTSSILNNWQGMRSTNDYPGDPFHIDYISIPGATIRELHHAFRAEYGNTHRPVDVILCSGLNDVINGSTSDQIMEEIYDFDKTVRSICFGDNSAYWSSFAATTLPFPPQLVSLSDEDRKLQRNCLNTLVDITTRIREMNRSDKHPHIPTYMAPCFHTWGVRIKQHSKLTGPANLMENFVDHRLVSWKGSKPKRMLHLTDALKLKMGRAVVEYFKVIYRMKEDSYRSKNEALTHRSTKCSKM